MRIERPLGRLDDRMGRAPAGLPDLQVQHVAAGHGALIGHAQHVECYERIDSTPTGDLQRHAIPPFTARRSVPDASADRLRRFPLAKGRRRTTC